MHRGMWCSVNGWSIRRSLDPDRNDYVMQGYYGQALTGASRYTITFDNNDMPPVTEFWELPLLRAERWPERLQLRDAWRGQL